MVGSGAPFLHEFVTELGWKREVGQAAVQVPELDLAEPELEAPKAMRVGRHSVPAQDRSLDGLERSIHARVNAQKRPAISTSEPPQTENDRPTGSRQTIRYS